jgi:hypothetical protein
VLLIKQPDSKKIHPTVHMGRHLDELFTNTMLDWVLRGLVVVQDGDSAALAFGKDHKRGYAIFTVAE